MNRMTWIAAAVAACAASMSPSQAFTDADLDRLAAEILDTKTAPGVGDAINDLSSELIECSAITMVSAICIGKTPPSLTPVSPWKTFQAGPVSWASFSEAGLACQRGHSAHASRPPPMTLCATFLLVAAISASCSSVFESPVKHSSQVPRID